MAAYWYFLVLSGLVAIKAVPSCNRYGTDVVCTAGGKDYVLKRGLVSDNNDTTGITLRDCEITDIDYESFENLNALKYLDLSRNKLRRLKLGVLDESHAVTYLNLSYNLLDEFPLGLFDQKPNVDVLDLKGNELNYLELGILDPFSKLRYLDLSSNKLTGRNMSAVLFDNNHNIGFLDFSRNNMSDTPANILLPLVMLDFLNLDRCFLTEVPQFATKSNLKTMKHLMLSNNLIAKIDDPTTFVELEKLEILNLVANRIESIKENVFQPLRNIKMIVLTENKLKEIPDMMFQNLPLLSNIDLAKNSLEYVSHNAFRGTNLKNLNLAANKITYLQDNFCLELRNSGARLKKFYFNQNPWQCSCMLQLLKEVKYYDIEYNGVKYDGKQPVCVTSKQFACKRHRSDNEYFVDLYDNLIG